jgi:hypothetical protein
MEERENYSLTAIFPTVTSEAVPPNVVSLLSMSIAATSYSKYASSNVWLLFTNHDLLYIIIYPLNVRFTVAAALAPGKMIKHTTITSSCGQKVDTDDSGLWRDAGWSFFGFSSDHIQTYNSTVGWSAVLTNQNNLFCARIPALMCASMIYPVFLAVSAILYLAALCPPATNMTSMSLQRTKNIQKDFLIFSSHDKPASWFTPNGSHWHQSSPRNVQFPSIFYLPQRRDSPSDLSRNRAS